jgi:hypothetical protein
MPKITFEDFCHQACDGLYDPKFPLESQCTGYKQLLKMISEYTEPASPEEMKRWEKHPTLEELLSPPDLKYLRFLHHNLRPYIIEHWDAIVNLIASRVEFEKVEY